MSRIGKISLIHEFCKGKDTVFTWKEVVKDMEQIERIKKMEEYLEISAKAIDELESALGRYEKARVALKELSDYYESPLWLKDFEDDEAGRLPEGLKKGVLSEDGVYDVLTRGRDVTDRMKGIVDASE